jgi:hypothetical protein
MLLQPVNNAGFVVNMPTRQDNAPISDLVVLITNSASFVFGQVRNVKTPLAGY